MQLEIAMYLASHAQLQSQVTLQACGAITN